MRLIHCADLHLDARMESTLPKEKARERRIELLRTFTRLVDDAGRKQADAVLLCGDLFDAKTISARARNCVLDAIAEHPDIIFYYLQGNHDQNSFLAEPEKLPENLRTFGADWVSYEQGEVCITGAEIRESTADGLMERLILDAGRVNIVMLHGMMAEYGRKNQQKGFSLRGLRGRNIDYLALGHVHSYQEDKLDDRGVWCYCGCPEGRGFDECGEKGYVFLEVQGGKVSSEFVPFAGRRLHEIEVDISGLLTHEEICRAAERELAGIPGEDLVKIVLTGEVSPEAERDTDWIQRAFADDFYFVRVKDKSRLFIRPEDYRYDISLKGEFVRLALASRMAKEDREEVLRLGIRALAGEE